MNKEKLKKALPTVYAYFERREKVKQNQLPKHLRPLSRRPLYAHVALNLAIIFTLMYLMMDRDEFLTEGGPALVMVICLIFAIFSMTSAVKLRASYIKQPGERLARLNIWLMAAALLMFPLTVAFFLP